MMENDDESERRQGYSVGLPASDQLANRLVKPTSSTEEANACYVWK